jgi:hypothetical protein
LHITDPVECDGVVLTCQPDERIGTLISK